MGCDARTAFTGRLRQQWTPVPPTTISLAPASSQTLLLIIGVVLREPTLLCKRNLLHCTLHTAHCNLLHCTPCALLSNTTLYWHLLLTQCSKLSVPSCVRSYWRLLCPLPRQQSCTQHGSQLSPTHPARMSHSTTTSRELCKGSVLTVQNHPCAKSASTSHDGHTLTLAH